MPVDAGKDIMPVCIFCSISGIEKHTLKPVFGVIVVSKPYFILSIREIDVSSNEVLEKSLRETFLDLVAV